MGSREVIPEEVLNFIGAQLDITGDALLTYASGRQTRQEHLVALREIYGYRMFTGKRARRMKSWLAEQAEAAQSSEELVRCFVEECRRRQIILPGISTIERLCAEAAVKGFGRRTREARDAILACAPHEFQSRLRGTRGQVPGNRCSVAGAGCSS